MNKIELYHYAKNKIEKHAEKCNISQERLETAYYQPNDQTECSDKIFYLFCSLLQDRQYMGNIIKFYHENSNTQEILKKVLFNYDPKKVKDAYCNADEIMAEIKKIEPSKIQNEDKWREYLSGIYQCTDFLINGKIGDTEISINRIMQKPDNIDEMKKYVYDLRPIINNMKGVGSAVCYNWLKECGAVWLAKPDLHIKRVVARLMLKQMEKNNGIIQEPLNIINDTDKIIKKYMDVNPDKTKFPANSGINRNCKLYLDEFVAIYMYEWAEKIKNLGEDENCTAYKLDRILYLYCTNGFFYLDREKSNDISEQDLLNAIAD